MALYLFQGSYTAATAAALVKKPQNRLRAIKAAVEKLGGSVEGGWMTFGKYDYAVICRFRDNVTAASFAFAVASGGAVAHNQTTLLLTFEEAMKATRRAAKAGYRPPR